MSSSSPTVASDQASDISSQTGSKGAETLSPSESQTYLSRPERDSKSIETTEIYNRDIHQHQSRGPELRIPSPPQTCVPRTKNIRSTRTIINNYWIWEMISCVCGLIGALGAFLLLLDQDGTDLENQYWTQAPHVVVSYIGSLIKLSTVMVLSGILSQLKWLHFKVANPLRHLRVFDNASRGPIGSVTLLWSLRRWLASIAAILMISSLLIDPFLQLAITFPTIPVIDETQQSLYLASKIFDPHIDNQGFAARYHGEAQYTMYSKASKEMMKAIDHGLSPSNRFLNTTCPTGNCIWPQNITMLGVCGGCDDLTASIVPNCTQGPPAQQHRRFHSDYTAWGRSYDPEITNVSQRWVKEDVNRLCEYSFPTLGSTKQVLTLSGRGYRTPGGIIHNMKNLLWHSSMDESVRSRSGDRAYIIRFFALQSSEMEPDDELFPNVRAWTCELTWCAKTLSNITVRKGQRLFTKAVERDLYYNRSDLDSELQVLYAKKNPLSADEKFFVDDCGAAALQSQLELTFSVSYGPKTALWMDQSQENGLIGDTLMTKEIATAENLDHTIKKLAASLTDLVRTSRFHDRVEGHTLINKTIVRVDWAWLVLPILLPILTSILLAVVAIRSHAKGVISWKDDPLALLCHKLDDADLISLDEGEAGTHTLDSISKHLLVELSSTKRLTLIRRDATTRKALPWWKMWWRKEDQSRLSRAETCLEV